MKKIAITGTIASGKSIASQTIRMAGYPVFDCDGYSRICFHKNNKAYTKMVKQFGDEILDDNGEIDKAKLSAIVFDDESKRKQLEAIIQPVILEGMLKAMETCDSSVFFAEVPLLYDAGWDKYFDEVVIITCDKEIAINRCINDRGYSQEEALKRYNSQIDPQIQIERATKVFYNNETLKKFQVAIRKWLREL